MQSVVANSGHEKLSHDVMLCSEKIPKLLIKWIMHGNCGIEAEMNRVTSTQYSKSRTTIST